MEYKKIYEAYADDLATYQQARDAHADFINKTNAKADALRSHWSPEGETSFDLNGVHFDVKVRYSDYNFSKCSIYIYPSTLANEEEYNRYIIVERINEYIFHLLRFALKANIPYYTSSELSINLLRYVSNKEALDMFTSVINEFNQKYDEIMAPLKNFSKNLGRYMGVKKAAGKRLEGPNGRKLRFDANSKRSKATNSFVDEYNVKPGDEVYCSVGGEKVKVTVTSVNDDGTISIVTPKGGRKKISIRDLAYENLPNELD